jgi:hypothetical protein
MFSAAKELQIGQTIQLEELEFSCRLTILPPEQPGQRLVELGSDYLVLEDPATETQRRIPLYLCVLSQPSAGPQAA